MIGVVGSNGFIGKTLSSYLVSKGETVIEYTSTTPIFDKSGLVQNFDKLDQIIWCASKVNPSSASKCPELIEEEIENWTKFLSLIELKANKNPRIVFLSSAGCTYSGTDFPLNEHSVAEGTNSYGKLKIRIEELLKESGLGFVILRLSNVYGPDQPRGRGQGVLAEWIGAIEESAPLKIYGSLEQFRDYIHISDVCTAIFEILKSEYNAETLNVGSGKATKLGEILKLIQQNLGSDLQTHVFPARGFDRPGYFLDISKMLRGTRWKPTITIESGISDLVLQAK